MQTAVELLKQDIDLEIKLGTKMVVNWDMYLEMEKQQIVDAHYQGYRNFIDTTEISEQYYSETYGSKGSDDHIVDTNEMISSQTEISDEEIEMAALHNEPRVTRRAFKSGAKWYREQLNNLKLK